MVRVLQAGMTTRRRPHGRRWTTAWLSLAAVAITAPALAQEVRLGRTTTTLLGAGVHPSLPLSYPTDVVLNPAGTRLYFSEGNLHAVYSLDVKTGEVAVAAGIPESSGYSGDGGPASAAKLVLPEGLAFDAAGNLYIYDETLHVLRMVDTAGTITTVAGQPGVFGKQDGAALSATLGGDSGLAVDPAGNVYIADSGNVVVRKYSPMTGQVTTVIGSSAFTYTNGNELPRYIAVDSEGTL
ncbi:MAG: hypothetical protein V4555_20895, partial [Acidobacteriota bacterium]